MSLRWGCSLSFHYLPVCHPTPGLPTFPTQLGPVLQIPSYPHPMIIFIQIFFKASGLRPQFVPSAYIPRGWTLLAETIQPQSWTLLPTQGFSLRATIPSLDHFSCSFSYSSHIFSVNIENCHHAPQAIIQSISPTLSADDKASSLVESGWGPQAWFPSTFSPASPRAHLQTCPHLTSVLQAQKVLLPSSYYQPTSPSTLAAIHMPSISSFTPGSYSLSHTFSWKALSCCWLFLPSQLTS